MKSFSRQKHRKQPSGRRKPVLSQATSPGGGRASRIQWIWRVCQVGAQRCQFYRPVRRQLYKSMRKCGRRDLLHLFDTLSNETHCVGLSFEEAAARRSALAVRRWRTTRTFASRNVFSPTHMSPEKMIKTLFAPAGANSARLFLQSEPDILQRMPGSFCIALL